MFDSLTWDAILQEWSWFGSAAAVLVIAVGLLIAVKPKFKRHFEAAATIADNNGWILTGGIDFAASPSVAELVLEVEEIRTSLSPSDVEHREIRWRRATLPEAKMVLESYHAQRNLAMSPSFAATASGGAKQIGNGQGESELKDVANGQDMADVTLVPKDVTH
jgi:hypothetical protein